VLTFTILVAVFIADPADPAARKSPVAGRPAFLPETEILVENQFTLSVPKGWRSQKSLLSSNMLLFMLGDGKGLPALDENGSPLQVGITVERFATEETLDEGIAALVKAAKQASQLRIAAEPTVEETQLRGKTRAKVLTTEFIKPSGRRSLQLKVCLKGRESDAWVVSGWVVAGERSVLPKPDSDLAKRLRALLKTFSLRASDEKP
jgi:hypothetical protein